MTLSPCLVKGQVSVPARHITLTVYLSLYKDVSVLFVLLSLAKALHLIPIVSFFKIP